MTYQYFKAVLSVEIYNTREIGRDKLLVRVSIFSANNASDMQRITVNANLFISVIYEMYSQRNNFVNIESVKIDIGNGFFMDDFVMEKTL